MPSTTTSNSARSPDPQARRAWSQRTARLVGVLFLITFITSIAALALYQPALTETGYVTGAGSDAGAEIGAFLEMLLIVANIGTAVFLFPILRRRHEGLALGYVTARLVECGFIAVGLVSVLAIVALHQDPAGADAGSLRAVARSLAAIHDETFLLGPGFVVGIGNGMILGYLMYRTGLVPRRLTLLGLVGGPLVTVSGAAILLGAFDAGSAPQLVATIPEFLWELLLGLYLTIKGFRPEASVLAGEPAADARALRRVAAAA